MAALLVLRRFGLGVGSIVLYASCSCRLARSCASKFKFWGAREKNSHFNFHWSIVSTEVNYWPRVYPRMRSSNMWQRRRLRTKRFSMFIVVASFDVRKLYSHSPSRHPPSTIRQPPNYHTHNIASCQSTFEISNVKRSWDESNIAHSLDSGLRPGTYQVQQ